MHLSNFWGILYYEDGRLRYEGHYNHSIILYEKSY